jgi:hypothetical protein
MRFLGRKASPVVQTEKGNAMRFTLFYLQHMYNLRKTVCLSVKNESGRIA